MRVLKLQNRKALLEKPVKGILIDVTEQPIERPVCGRRNTILVKRNGIPLKHN